MKIRKTLLAQGGVFAIAETCPTTCGACFQCTRDETLPKQENAKTINMPDGKVFKERPSENGAGWYAGELYDTDCLIYDEVATA